VAILGLALLLGVVVVAGEVWLAWWATGGGIWGLVGSLLLLPLALLLAHRMWLFAFLLLWDGGSVRQAKRRLQEAEREGRAMAALKERVVILLLRHRRRV
jgi:hypothetical protein